MPPRETTLDDTAFLRGLKLADARVARAVRRAFAKLLAQAERRAKELCPIDQRPRAAGGTLAATIQGDARTIEVTANRVTARLTAGGGEAADYAVRQHEEPLTHSHPVSGVYASKYVEQPIHELSRVAGAYVADEVRKELGG